MKGKKNKKEKVNSWLKLWNPELKNTRGTCVIMVAHERSSGAKNGLDNQNMSGSSTKHIKTIFCRTIFFGRWAQVFCLKKKIYSMEILPCFYFWLNFLEK